MKNTCLFCYFLFYMVISFCLSRYYHFLYCYKKPSGVKLISGAKLIETNNRTYSALLTSKAMAVFTKVLLLNMF